VDEHPNAQVPLDIPFLDDHAAVVTLRQFMHKDKPVVLQLGYFGCPMLCDVISRNLIETAKGVDVTAGKDFQFVFLSIDTNEPPSLAESKKRSFVDQYGRPESAEGIHCLIGQEKNIRLIADTVGFRYKKLDTGTFSHPAVLFVLTPDGKVSRYLYGAAVKAQTLQLSLVEASQGKIGTTLDEIFLMICCYDVATGKYTLAASRLMTVGGLMTLAVMSGWMFWLFRHGGQGQLARRYQVNAGSSMNQARP
jgi:protein SCO1/2